MTAISSSCFAFRSSRLACANSSDAAFDPANLFLSKASTCTSVFIGEGPFEALVASDRMARRTFNLTWLVSPHMFPKKCSGGIDLGLSFALIAVFKSFLILASNGGAGSEVVEVCRIQRKARHFGCLMQRSVAAATDILMIGYLYPFIQSLCKQVCRTNTKSIMIELIKFWSIMYGKASPNLFLEVVCARRVRAHQGNIVTGE